MRGGKPMSELKRMVELTPPDYLSMEQRLTSRDMECGYCHGRGTFVYDDRYGDDVVKICPMCQGQGRVDAEITIKWKPSNNINNPQKQ